MTEPFLPADLDIVDAGASASPPYPVPRHSLPGVVRRFGCVVRVMLAEYRTNWFYHMFFGTFLPIGLFFFLTIVNPQFESRRALYLLSGNMATSIAYGPAHLLIVKIGLGRQSHQFDYWATLPVTPLMLILAIVLVYLLFALPGLVITYLIGCWVLHFPVVNGLTLLPVVPLAVLSLTGIGALIGSHARDAQMTTIYAQSLIGVVTFLAPAMVPPENLPTLMRICATLVPTTYVAAIFRAALEGHYGQEFIINILILAGFTICSLVLAQRKLDWRLA